MSKMIDSPAQQRQQRMVLHSALWAAAGDALGWITELSHGESGVRHRTGATSVTHPIPWVRTIGGRRGARVNLPAGTYSDDTQLRLAVARSIRGNGSFDVEAFAKVELTVWPTYGLGAGLGTKAAAANLTRRTANWFSNFYTNDQHSYVTAGGNGAAMRIQPHVWSSPSGSPELLLNVLRNALVTHGHPHGFCGAILHALALQSAFEKGVLPPITVWKSFIERFAELSEIISRDPQLSAFWKATWESNSKRSLDAALELATREALDDLAVIEKNLSLPATSSYHRIVEGLGCLSPKFRGSGLKTVLASMALSEIFRDSSIEEALACAANELESDTDTISTMAGAFLGSVATYPPEWPIQDVDYITKEAARLSALAFRIPQMSFNYPDLGLWNPPAKQNAAIGIFENGLAIAGLGRIIPMGVEYQNGDSIWQWCSLSFGQTILAKRKTKVRNKIMATQLPGPLQEPQRDVHRVNSPRSTAIQSNLPLESNSSSTREAQSHKRPMDLVDSLSDKAIASGFDDLTLGRLFNECIDSTSSVESALGFAAIVAKAKLARARRQR